MFNYLNYQFKEIVIMKILRLCAIAVLALALVGCAKPGLFSIGGWIPSEGGGGKANFGGYIDACNLSNPYGHVTYHDKNATMGHLRLEGRVVDAAQCVDDSPDAEGGCVKCQYLAEQEFGSIDFPEDGSLAYAKIRYRSQNKKEFDGMGYAVMCVADFGEGANASMPDYVFINVTSGPYDDYYNWGEVQGNINEEECDPP
jgi:hypothetical protein